MSQLYWSENIVRNHDTLCLWDRSLIHIIGSYLDKGENGLLNLLSSKYYNQKYKLNINAFIFNKKMRNWFCSNFHFDIKIVNCHWSAKKGYFDCLKYAHNFVINSCSLPFGKQCVKCPCDHTPWNEWTCRYAAKNGHLDCLKYAYENGWPWNIYTSNFAAKNGHLDCLKYARENGCPWDKYTCSNAALNGHLNCLKYARENGCPRNTNTCKAAAYYGNLECLKYAYENGCPYDRSDLINYITDPNCLKYIKKMK